VNIVFLLTAEGKLNYYGLKKWIEEQSETNESKSKRLKNNNIFIINKNFN